MKLIDKLISKLTKEFPDHKFDYKLSNDKYKIFMDEFQLRSKISYQESYSTDEENAIISIILDIASYDINSLKLK